jgi:hypothetical protein
MRGHISPLEGERAFSVGRESFCPETVPKVVSKAEVGLRCCVRKYPALEVVVSIVNYAEMVAKWIIRRSRDKHLTTMMITGSRIKQYIPGYDNLHNVLTHSEQPLRHVTVLEKSSRRARSSLSTILVIRAHGESDTETRIGRAMSTFRLSNLQFVFCFLRRFCFRGSSRDFARACLR